MNFTYKTILKLMYLVCCATYLYLVFDLINIKNNIIINTIFNECNISYSKYYNIIFTIIINIYYIYSYYIIAFLNFLIYSYYNIKNDENNNIEYMKYKYLRSYYKIMVIYFSIYLIFIIFIYINYHIIDKKLSNCYLNNSNLSINWFINNSFILCFIIIMINEIIKINNNYNQIYNNNYQIL